MADLTSRYGSLPEVAVLDARGRVVLARELRLLPVVTGTVQHWVHQGDRLDELAHRYYGTGPLWWRICDANPAALSPLDLLEGGPVATTRVGARPTAGGSGWASLVRRLTGLVGVDRVLVIDGEAVLVTHNRATVSSERLIAEIGAAGFTPGPSAEAGPAGQPIIVPPRLDG